MIDFECPNCGQELSAENSDRGNVFPCPQCGENVQVPNAFKLPEKKRQVTIRSSSQRECPFCGELIQKTAMKCRYCGEWLTAPDQADIDRVKQRMGPDGLSALKNQLARNGIAVPTGRTPVKRSFADKYGFRQTKQKVEKPGSVTFAVFLSFAQLALGLISAWTDPNAKAYLAARGDSTMMMMMGIVAFISFLFILGLNAGMNWIRWLYLILTPIYLVLFVIGVLITLPMIPPILQIGSAVISAVVFFNLASESAGMWYRAVANGQNR